MKARSSPTSRDVAERAGVSRSIVSGVLTGTMSTMRVSQETRERVLDAARELGYSPNPVARALRQQRSNVIGFVPRADRINPYDAPVPFLLATHLGAACADHGYHFVTASAESPDHGDTRRHVDFLLGRHVDGIVLDSPGTPDEATELVRRGIPVVQMIRPHRDVPASSVTIDPAPGMTEAIRHLVEAGHREIGFIGTGGRHQVDRSRLDAFHEALGAAGLSAHDEWIVLVDRYNTANGLHAAAELLRRPTLPTAVLVTGDNLAAGMLQHLYECGVRVPEHLSVISYDDIYASHLAPPLTSVNQPLAEAARLAVEMLLAEIDTPTGERGEPRAIVLPTRLVSRGSVRQIEPKRTQGGI